MRVAHVISEFSAKEAMGRTVTETATRTAGEHHLITTAAHDGADVFASVTELGGGIGTFPFNRRAALARALTDVAPDIVHLHAGAMGPLQIAATAMRDLPTVLTMYGWPRLPPIGTMRRVPLRSLRSSNVAPPRVLITHVLPRHLSARALRACGTAVLSPDPGAIRRLESAGIEVDFLPSGAAADSRRAVFSAEPTILFAGRSERVRGISTLIAAFEGVRAQIPAARLRLLLIPRAELEGILAEIEASPVRDAIEVMTEPLQDLQGEMAAATVGTWPFLFDYTTSPPAMAAAEALAVGLPVVSTDVGCVRAIITDGDNGLLVPPADPGALAQALCRVLGDQALWNRLATAGPRTIEGTFNWAHVAELTGQAYLRALDGVALN